MDPVELKHRLRELKKLENRLRYGTAAPTQSPLVWAVFFDLQPGRTGRARYPLAALTAMGADAYKAVVAEYWAFVYQELFQERGLPGAIHFDTDTLQKLDLPYDADEAAVKRRFRELAKRTHPDAGGDAGEFIKLMELYRTLIQK